MARKVEKADSRERKDKALALFEAIKDYALADALDGNFNESAWTDAHAAFAVADVERLDAIEKQTRRKVKFVEPKTALKGQVLTDDPEAKKDGKTAMEKRIAILKARKGTRMYARLLLEANISETPFGPSAGASR